MGEGMKIKDYDLGSHGWKVIADVPNMFWIEIDSGTSFDISQTNDGLRIQTINNTIIIHPESANTITISEDK